MKRYNIDPDIRKSSTLPAAFYRSRETFQEVKEKIFVPNWQFAGLHSAVATPGMVQPFTLLPGVLEEPLVITHDQQGKMHCLSNVCTHRGKIVVEKAGRQRLLSCSYHGRCFGLDGQFRSMPAFDTAEDFPGPADHLPRLALENFLGLLFVSIKPAVAFAEMIRPLKERLFWLPFDQLTHEPRAATDYHVKANWALYVDNYLEGFHIPFVHPGLNQALIMEDYEYEIHPYCNLQLGIARQGEKCFDLPPESLDYGKKILAYYWWVFPNLMFNIYPWGVSFNSVEPLNHQETMVRFRSFYFPGFSYQEENKTLHQTELEDETVVESVQLGIQSRLYQQGRFSPTMEQGVHHFHRLINAFLSEEENRG